MFFDERISLRLRKDTLKLIDKIVTRDNISYDSEAHFIRCAVLKLVRDEVDRLRIGKFVTIRKTGKIIRLEDVKNDR